MDFNEESIKEGEMKLRDYVQALDTETGRGFNIFHAKLEIESHALRASHAVMTIQNKIDVLIYSIINAQRGIVQPHIIYPKDLVDNLVRVLLPF